MRRRRALLAVLLTLSATAAAVWLSTGKQAVKASFCMATLGTTSYRLDPEQGANATTIAAVGKRMGYPDHAVTVALATALQESELHNLDHGDLDSVGLFQQRPSQGWGTRDQILVPSYAARRFFAALGGVPGWQTMSVAEAAQAVQRSAAPDAYSQREPEARLLAIVLTGEAPASFTCSSAGAKGPVLTESLSAAAQEELGPATIGVPVSTPEGWTAAAWLVARAPTYRLGSVAFAGYRWSQGHARWTPDPSAGSSVIVSGQ